MADRTRVTLEQLLLYIDDKFKASVEEVDEFAVKQREVHGLQRVQWKVLPVGKTKNITEISTKLRLIFEPFVTEMIRHGVPTHHGSSNISLFYSLAMLLNLSGGDFSMLGEEKQLEFISNMKYKLINDIKDGKLLEQYNYTEYGWRKHDLLDAISNLRNDRRVLRIMADYLNINIFLLNIVEDKLIAVYREPYFCEFKASVFLSYYDDVFEPIIYKNKLTLTYNDEPLRKVFKVEHRHVHLVDFEKIPRVFESKPEDLNASSLDGFVELGTPGQYEEAATTLNTDEDEMAVTTAPEEIFVKKQKKQKTESNDTKSAVKTESEKVIKSESEKVVKPKKKKIDYSVLSNVSVKMTLAELQGYATTFGISLKNGTKAKTKAVLSEELMQLYAENM